MFNSFISAILILVMLTAGSSCSSSEEISSAGAYKSFDVYDQPLEVILESVAEHFELDLDFDIDESADLYSLSIRNASIEDVLEKIASQTGHEIKLIDNEIIIQDEIFEEGLVTKTYTLNENLWVDLRSVVKNLEIDEEVVKNYFGPLFRGVHVLEVDGSRKQITLQMEQKHETYISKSLLYLNYLQQRRNSAVTVMVVSKGNEKDFLSTKKRASEAEFAWRFNAGDNLIFKNDKGKQVNIQSQLLSEKGNASETEIFLSFSYDGMKSEGNYDFSGQNAKTIELSQTHSLLLKLEWFTNGMKLGPETSSSKFLANQKENIPEYALKTLSGLSSGESNLAELVEKVTLAEKKIRLVSLVKNGNSDPVNFKFNSNGNGISIDSVLKQLSSKNVSAHFDSNGILIDCQATVSREIMSEWKILPESLDTSYLSFVSGAFKVEKEGLNDTVQYLPSAKALVGFKNSNILK